MDDTKNMSYIKAMEEIKHRQELDKKGTKVTPEEKEWFATHAYYHEAFGFPILRRDCIRIDPDCLYEVNVQYESHSGAYVIHPTIEIPMKKGNIDCGDMPLVTIDKKPTKPKKVTFLSLDPDNEYPISTVKLFSQLGCFGVLYHCYVKNPCDYEYPAGSDWLGPLGMKKEQISDNKCRYSCNDRESTDFKSYVFTVEWINLGPRRTARKK